MKTLALLCLLLLPTACTEEVKHDEKLAITRAIEFAETTFVRHNLDQGYALLADNARSYVPMNIFTDKVNKMHPSGRPSKITSVSAVPVKGEKIVYVTLRGEGDSRYTYAITLAGTAASDYRVTIFGGERSS